MKYSGREKEEIIKNKFPHWHYRFDLGDGVITQPFNPNIQKWHEGRKKFIIGAINSIFDNSLKGLRCLDVACNAWFWTFELAKMEGEYILAIDKEKYCIDQAIFVKDCIQQGDELESIDFRHHDLFEMDEKMGTFDLVILLGIVYHLTDIVGFFKKVHYLVKRLIIIDTMVSVRDEPILELSNSTKFAGCSKNEFSFVPTIKSLVHILWHVGFKNIMKVLPTQDLLEPLLKEERIVLIAYK